MGRSGGGMLSWWWDAPVVVGYFRGGGELVMEWFHGGGKLPWRSLHCTMTLS